ncbi:MAG: FkbM family methyltransferase [Acidobacteria bacterium]|nr:FkbM family methyltransferase [Acidobacteriota bacterium]
MILNQLRNQLLLWAGSEHFTVRVNDELLRLPRRLYRQIGVDLGMRRGIYFEVPVMAGLRRILRPGDCVFDAGCSYGIITCLISRMVQPGGAVHAFEANPDVLTWTRHIVSHNLPSQSVHFVSSCLADHSEGATDFYAVPDKSSVASTRNKDILHFHPDSQRVSVPLLSLDDYCARSGAIPRCIKLDVEGSEYLVLKGARRLLETHRPALLIETHGLEIDGIGGSVAELCRLLRDARYHLQYPISGQQVTDEDYVRKHASQIGYLLAT